MEELNKTQLILLALLLSFVTSIATGIVTVTLMDQAPAGVIQTIDRVVEKTVEVVQPEKETQIITQETVVREGDLIEEAIAENLSGLVTLYTSTGEERQELGSGFLVSADGLVVTDVDMVSYISSGNVYATYKEKDFAVEIVSYDETTYVLVIRLELLDAEDSLLESFFQPVSLTTKASLGSSVIGIDTTNGVRVGIGIVTRLEKEDVVTDEGEVVDTFIKYIHTDMSMPATAGGGPLILSGGDVAGMLFVSKENEILAVPGEVIQEVLDVIVQRGVETMIEEQGASVINAVIEGKTEENTETEQPLTE